jgi:predicted DNA-binding transcriptional regulator AlpA
MRADERSQPLPISLPPRGLSRVEAAVYVGVSPTSFDRMVSEGQMPRPARYRRRLLWDRRQIDRALDAIFNEPDQGAGAYAAAPEFAL